MRGRIRSLIAVKGFAFVREEASGMDYFFHRASNPDLFDEMLVGDVVEFEGHDTNRGPRVTAIERV
jgi:cold shock CspA family protein